MTKMYIRLSCLTLVLLLTLSVFGACKKSAQTTSSSATESTESITSEEEIIEENPVESTDEVIENPIIEDELIDDTVNDDSVEDEYIEDAEDLYYDELYIHNGEVINEGFRGINMIHMLYSRMPDKYGRVYDQKQLAMESETLSKMGINMIRTFYGSSYSYDSKTGKHDFSENSPYLEGFIQGCLEMQRLGITVGIAPNNLKSLFTTNCIADKQTVDLSNVGYCVLDPEAPNGVNVDATIKKFENYMTDSVTYFKARGVNNVKQIYCFTEVNNTIYASGIYNDADKPMMERRHYDELIPIYDRMVRSVDSALKKANLRDQYEIVGPCDNWRFDFSAPSEGYSTLVRYCVENLKDEIDVIASHNGYNHQDSFTSDSYYDFPVLSLSEPYTSAVSAGKEFWIDEYNVTDSYTGTEEARISKNQPLYGVAFSAMVNGVLNTGMDNVIIWSLYDQQWPDKAGSDPSGEFQNGIQIVGFLPSYFESVTPRKAWYATSLLTKYIGTGDVLNCEIGLGVYISAIKRDDGELTVVVTNYNFTETPVKIRFDESLGGKTFYRYLYNPEAIIPSANHEMISHSAVISDVEYGFSDVYEGAAVAVYTTVKPEK